MPSWGLHREHLFKFHPPLYTYIYVCYVCKKRFGPAHRRAHEKRRSKAFALYISQIAPTLRGHINAFITTHAHMCVCLLMVIRIAGRADHSNYFTTARTANSTCLVLCICADAMHIQRNISSRDTNLKLPACLLGPTTPQTAQSPNNDDDDECE